MVWSCVAVAAFGSSARAADCGGGKPCRCGDRVVDDYALTEDLGPCPGDGLRVASRVVLDGAGHEISGTGGKTVGVQLNPGASGSKVLRLTVRGFERGIRLNGAQQVELTDVTAAHNGDFRARVGYGIDVAAGASGNRIERAKIHDNADEGIHFGKSARANRLTDSEVYDNGRENVYVLDGFENAIEGCTLRGGGNAAAYVKHAKGTVLARNRIFDRPIVVRGAARGTRLVDDAFSGAGLVVQPYADKQLGATIPADTVVRGGSVEGADVCIRIDEARDTTLDGVRLDCDTALVVAGGSAVSVVDTALGKVRCAGPGEVRDVARVDVSFVDPDGAPARDVRLASGDRELGKADAAGRFEGDVARSVRACPRLEPRPAPSVRVTSGDVSRTFEPSELHGTIALGEAGGAAGR